MSKINLDFIFRHLDDLRCLFLQHNRLEKIENLNACQKLTTLNMSHNFLTVLTGLANLPNLHTLIVSHNKFCGVKDLEELIGCKELAVLDLSNNSIDESEVINQVLHHMENLKVLTYMGNPIVRKTKDYRLVIFSIFSAKIHLTTEHTEGF